MKTTTLKQAVKIVKLFEDTPVEQTQALLESGLLADLRDGNIAGVNRDEFRRLVGLIRQLESLSYRITVNRDLSLKKVIDAERFKFDYIHPDITEENFYDYSTNTRDVVIELVEFEFINSNHASNQLSSRGLRFASIRELIVLGARAPLSRDKSPIITLASNWEYVRYRYFMVCLTMGDCGTSSICLNLDIIKSESIYPARHWFATVHK